MTVKFFFLVAFMVPCLSLSIRFDSSPASRHRGGFIERSTASARHLKPYAVLRSSVSPPFQMEEVIVTPHGPFLSKQNNLLHSRADKPGASMDGSLTLGVCATYFCNMFAATLPIVLLPMIAVEQSTLSSAAFVATVASVSVLGGAVGKFVNGFVCQRFGGRHSSALYLVGLALSTFLLSTVKSSHVGLVVAAIEFFASIQWTACSVVLCNHYESDPKTLSSAVSKLALASTTSVLACKVTSSIMLQYFNWRQVAQLGSILAITGFVLMKKIVSEYPKGRLIMEKEPFNVQSILKSVQSLIGSRIFWFAALGQATAFLVRNCDKVLASFFHEITALPSSICGGLTASVTIGFVYGLLSSKKFHLLESLDAKLKVVRRNIFTAVLSALGLALSANKGFIGLLRAPSLNALAIFLASAGMASSVAFRFYQSPTMVGNQFGENKAVCMSFMDGMGFLLCSPVWALAGSLISNPRLSSYGWSLVWTIIAALLGIGGSLVLKILPPILEKQAARQH